MENNQKNADSANKNKEEIAKINELLRQNSHLSINTYNIIDIFGKGAFGVVYKAVCNETKETVAIKFVLQNKQYKNRELAIMKTLNHPNVIKLLHSFYIPSKENPDDQYLNCVMESLPDTLYKVLRNLYINHMQMDELLVKIYSFQLLRSLAYLHSLGICHRDLTPTNILINSSTGELKLCDFGSAKKLIHGETSIAYICSRFYRAPELIFGSTEYNKQIDMWSAGCIIAELVLGHPLFPGRDSSDQLVEIIKVIGSPTKEDIISMNEKYKDYKIPVLNKLPWTKVFKDRKIPDHFFDLLDKLLVFNPNKRLKPFETLNHAYFEDLIDKYKSKCTLENGQKLPDIFNFTKEEINMARSVCDKFKL